MKSQYAVDEWRKTKGKFGVSWGITKDISTSQFLIEHE